MTAHGRGRHGLASFTLFGQRNRYCLLAIGYPWPVFRTGMQRPVLKLCHCLCNSGHLAYRDRAGSCRGRRGRVRYRQAPARRGNRQSFCKFSGIVAVVKHCAVRSGEMKVHFESFLFGFEKVEDFAPHRKESLISKQKARKKEAKKA